MNMKRIASAVVVVLVFCLACAGADIAKIYRWDSTVELGDSFVLTPTRGETMVLQPRIMSYGRPMDLSGTNTVTLLYKAVYTNSVSTNVYQIAGSVLVGTNGLLSVSFGPSNELAASTYAYDLLVSGSTSTVVAARGAIKYRDGVAAGSTPTTWLSTYGWSTNISVIVSGGATQVMHFVGGILQP